MTEVNKNKKVNIEELSLEELMAKLDSKEIIMENDNIRDGVVKYYWNEYYDKSKKDKRGY